MKLHAGLSPARAVIIPKLTYRALGIVELTRWSRGQAAKLDRPIALPKCGNGVVVCVLARKFVGRAALQVQLQLALFRLGNHDGLLSQCQL